jgi:hypothetical protein
MKRYTLALIGLLGLCLAVPATRAADLSAVAKNVPPLGHYVVLTASTTAMERSIQ